MKKISVEVPEALDREVRVLAAHLDIDRSKFARLALQEKVARLNGEVPAVATAEISLENEGGTSRENVSQLSPAVDVLPPRTETR